MLSKMLQLQIKQLRMLVMTPPPTKLEFAIMIALTRRSCM
jgi:hypothetical protein